jgi:hypothetical protein
MHLRLLWSPDGEQEPPGCVCGGRPRLGYSPATAAYVFISFFKPNKMLEIFNTNNPAVCFLTKTIGKKCAEFASFLMKNLI